MNLKKNSAQKIYLIYPYNTYNTQTAAPSLPMKSMKLAQYIVRHKNYLYFMPWTLNLSVRFFTREALYQQCDSARYSPKNKKIISPIVFTQRL